MKRLLIGLTAMVAIVCKSMAQVVTVADVEALPGETVSFSLSMLGGKADTYTALSFDAHFPTSGFSTTGVYAVSDMWSGVMAVIGDVDGSGVATIPFSSANAIAGSEVENLVSVSFKVDESVAVGEYDVTLKNIMFEYGLSDKDYAENVTFKVNVVASHAVVLDEMSTVAPNAATDVKIIVKRTIKAGEWSTICLPFAMTAAQVHEAFGSDVELGDFAGYTVSDDGESINVNFNSATAIEANHPYIIKVSEAVTEFTVDGVDIAPEEEPTINKGTSRKPKAFIGNYVAGTTVDNGCLFLSGSKFWYSVGATKIKAFRAYFNFFDLLPDFEDNYAEAPVMIVFNDETTGISGVARNNSGGKVIYNLKGLRIGGSEKGIHIINNKKVVIK